MKITSIDTLYSIYLRHPKLSKDTRAIDKGCIYLALKGESFDGNKFAKEALDKGAAYVLIDDPQYAINDKYLLVIDVLKSLQELAKHHRNHLSIPIIAISGSNGKTTTKELVAASLSNKYTVLFTAGNYNNHIGVPLTLLRINSSHQIAIIEMGANHQGEIDFLCKIASPNYGMLTNIGKSHLEGFGGEAGVVKGKTELFKYLEKTDGSTFINLDDLKIENNAPSKNTITYSLNKEADCVGKIEETHPTLTGSWKTKDAYGYITSSLYGEYNFYNILAACCIANFFKVDSSKIDAAITSYHSEINRSQLIKINSNTIYLDAYNANPTSMGLSLENFEKVKSSSKVIIIGDMFELGEAAFNEHKIIVELAKNINSVETTVFVGANFYQHKKLFPKGIFIETTTECKAWYLKQNFQNSTILLKGSRGMKLESLLKK